MNFSVAIKCSHLHRQKLIEFLVISLDNTSTVSLLKYPWDERIYRFCLYVWQFHSKLPHLYFNSSVNILNQQSLWNYSSTLSINLFNVCISFIVIHYWSDPFISCFALSQLQRFHTYTWINSYNTFTEKKNRKNLFSFFPPSLYGMVWYSVLLLFHECWYVLFSIPFFFLFIIITILQIHSVFGIGGYMLSRVSETKNGEER